MVIDLVHNKRSIGVSIFSCNSRLGLREETENGIEDIWWILEGQDYPRLWWELIR
jgi:hypothetical protein